MITTMRLDPVNAVSSFHYYMWNAWGEEECKVKIYITYYHHSNNHGNSLQIH